MQQLERPSDHLCCARRTGWTDRGRPEMVVRPPHAGGGEEAMAVGHTASRGAAALGLPMAGRRDTGTGLRAFADRYPGSRSRSARPCPRACSGRWSRRADAALALRRPGSRAGLRRPDLSVWMNRRHPLAGRERSSWPTWTGAVTIVGAPPGIGGGVPAVRRRGPAPVFVESVTCTRRWRSATRATWASAPVDFPGDVVGVPLVPAARWRTSTCTCRDDRAASRVRAVRARHFSRAAEPCPPHARA